MKRISLFLILCILMSLLIFIPNVSAASVDVLEDFESYDIGSNPCLPTPIYTSPCNGLDGTRYSVSGSAFAQNVDSGPIGNDYTFQPTAASNGATANFDTHHDLCENPTGDGFQFSIGSNSASSPQFGTLLYLQGTVPGNPLVVSQNVYSFFFDNPSPSPTTGRLQVSVDNYEDNVFVGGASGLSIIYTVSPFAANQLYSFKVTCPSGPSSGTLTVTSLDSGDSDTLSVPANGGSNFITDNIWTIGAGDDPSTPVQLYDNINYDYTVPGISPTASSSTYFGIAGFDITKDGTAVTIRTNNVLTDQDVRVLNGDSLIESANTPIFTDCNRLHGVVGLGNAGFGYIHCAPGNAPDSMRFIGSDGGIYPTGCNNPGQVCDGAFAFTGAIPVANRNALSDIVPAIPGIIKKTGQQGSDYHELNYYSLVFSESAGLNVVAADFNYQYINPAIGANVFGEQLTADIAPDDSSIPDICGFGNLKIFTAHPGIPVKGFTVSNTYPNIDNVIPAIVNDFNGTANALLDASHIDCANDRLIATSATDLTIWNYATDTPVITKTISPTNAAVAFNTISGNGSYAAYSDGTLTHIINGLTGIDLATITNPDPLFDMEMDQCAQKLFLSSTTNVYEYDIVPYTTITPVSISNGTCIISSGIGSGSSSGSTTNIIAPTPTNPSLTGVCAGGLECNASGGDNHFWFGLNKTEMSSDFNITEAKFNWILTLLTLITIVLIIAAFISMNPFVIGLAVLGGLGACIAFGITPIWFLLLVIFFVVLVGVRNVLGGGGSE